MANSHVSLSTGCAAVTAVEGREEEGQSVEGEAVLMVLMFSLVAELC